MKKNLSIIMTMLVLLGSAPGLALSADMERDPSFRNPAFKAFKTPEIRIVRCRLNRLTDLVFPEKITKVVMSDSRPDDFKLVGTRVGEEYHLIVDPLKKGASSDLFIYGTNRVSYLRLVSVPKRNEYFVRLAGGEDKRAEHP